MNANVSACAPQRSNGAADMPAVPSIYLDGYAKARAVDRERADTYIRHTVIGDPELDPVMEELSDLSPRGLETFIRACVEQDDEATVRRAPRVLRDFVDRMEAPDWVEFDAFAPGQRAFFRDLNNMLIAYAVGSALEGFSTLVGKSFAITGRVPGLGPGAVRRLRQNNRHLVETYYPGGLRRGGEGWKVSLRIRFVHAQTRRLLAADDAWDREAWGTPLSAAHMGGIALYTFSLRQFEHAMAMGSAIAPEELESVVKIWRYGGYLLGVPEPFLFTSRAGARRMYEIGHLCEPPPDDDSARVANAVFEAIPTMAGLTVEKEQRWLQRFAYRLSRALIGNELADRFGYPNTIRSRFLVLLYYRLRDRTIKLLAKKQLVREQALSQIFSAAQYDEEGISYKMPDHVRAAQQSPW